MKGISLSVEMCSLLVEICSRQEAWMEMRTGTFVDPPQTLEPLALTLQLRNKCEAEEHWIACNGCLLYPITLVYM